jgi:hypothetical protein
MKPRDAYQAYLKGEITPAQAEREVQAWYSTSREPSPGVPKD